MIVNIDKFEVCLKIVFRLSQIDKCRSLCGKKKANEDLCASLL